VTTVLLVRHGRTTANSAGVLAGWTPGIDLDDVGSEQARALAVRLAGVPLAAAVTSPLQRCVSTAELALAGRGTTAVHDEGLGECHYGDWTGRELKSLAKDPLWKVVQQHPSAAIFPGGGGESLRRMQLRAVDAVRVWDAKIAAESGDEAVWAAFSHGDVIKAVVADALGMHLDAFQRIVVDPCSVTAIRYTPLRPFVLRLNDVGGELRGLVPAKPRRRRRKAGAGAGEGASDAVVGGGAGA
jgi:probable phosphomutase (TIGR03848 family)